MTYIKINDSLYEATITGTLHDESWNDRSVKAITSKSFDFFSARSMFVDGLEWSIVCTQGEPAEQEVYDNSEYCLVGDIILHKDGSVTVKMGTQTAEEILAELEAAYNED